MRQQAYVYQSPANAAALEVYFAGATAQALFSGAYTAAQLSNLTHYICKKLPGATSVTAPTSYFVSSWITNPYALGSLVFAKADANWAWTMHDDLYQAIGDSLYFAGDATHNLYPGTLHGAALTGLQAASDILGNIATLVAPAPPYVAPVFPAEVASFSAGYPVPMNDTDAIPLGAAIGDGACVSVSVAALTCRALCLFTVSPRVAGGGMKPA